MEVVLIKWQGKSKRQVCVDCGKNLISKSTMFLSVCMHFFIHATSLLTADCSAVLTVLSYSLCFFENNRRGAKEEGVLHNILVTYM